MRKFLLILGFVLPLFAVDFSTLVSSHGNGYENSNVYIDGKFISYRCTKDRKIGNERVDGYCKVQLEIFDSGKFLKYVAVYVGTTWESDFKSAAKGDSFSFSCTYHGSLSSFKGCR